MRDSIEIDYTLLYKESSVTLLKRYFCKLLQAYKEIFSSPPWNAKLRDEEWFDAVYERTLLKVEEGLLGVLGIDKNDNVVGFAWGYPFYYKGGLRKIRKVDSEKVVSILQELEKLEKHLIFYWAEFGVIPPYQRMGIGTNLFIRLTKLVKENDYQAIAYRTINPVVERIVDKFYQSTHKKHLFRDPIYSERLWSIFYL